MDVLDIGKETGGLEAQSVFTVAIIGGGFAGTTLAARLLRQSDALISVY